MLRLSFFAAAGREQRVGDEDLVTSRGIWRNERLHHRGNTVNLLAGNAVAGGLDLDNDGQASPGDSSRRSLNVIEPQEDGLAVDQRDPSLAVILN